MLRRELVLNCWLFFVCMSILGLLGPSLVSAQEAKVPAERIQRFAKRMSGVKLVGKFTIDGKDSKKLPTEEYVIQSAEKLPEGDLWLLTARIKYGDHDVTVPLPNIPVKWAGDTPMISISNYAIPGLGTFSARVFFYRDSYAGVWKHDDAGGHMFGKLVELSDDESAAKQR